MIDRDHPQVEPHGVFTSDPQSHAKVALIKNLVMGTCIDSKILAIKTSIFGMGKQYIYIIPDSYN